jgi:hypothetical protein
MSALTWPDCVNVHPAAELFPLMEDERFAEFVEDIKEHGLLESIVVTPNGAVLDGRHRLLACRATNTEPRFTTHEGNPWEYVISVNLHRRHLTDTQRAVVAGKMADRSPGERTSNASAEAFQAPPQREAAKLLNVSRSSVQRARTVMNQGTPAVTELVESGKVPLATAERVVRELTPADQDEFARKVNGGMRPRGAAPPERPAKPRVSRRAPKPPTDDAVISTSALQAIATDMTGLDLALKSITTLDPELTARDLEQFERAFTKGIQALSRIRRLMRKAPEGEQ